ncbi:MAG: tRNA (adenosine(37)-N6)-threonylcarbamoyltransferase complex dimerization subunit type 1 TsaB [Rhizobiaceae bacterium]
MITLAIDSSGPICAAAIHRLADDIILSEISEDIGRGHAERLMDVITATLDGTDLDYSSISKIAVAAGPGSFTGIRVGLATARGLALGLSVPALGVNTLKAHWYAAGGSNGLVVADARRDEAYCQFFVEDDEISLEADHSMPSGPFLMGYGELSEMIAAAPRENLTICGSGSGELNLRLSKLGCEKLTVGHKMAVPPISVIARIGAAMEYDGSSPEPIYLRGADAKPQTGFALERS